MCVILLIDNDGNIRPSDEMIENAWERNPEGGGIAWRENSQDGKGKEVVFHKDLSLDEMKELNTKLPLPYIMHFRIASSGGVKAELTHPFPIHKNVPLMLKGRTKGYVLFHNGDWKGYETECREAARGSNTKIPGGFWSDTRAMAWLMSIYGFGYMEMMSGQKGVAFGPTHYEVFNGPGWRKVKDGENEFWCSNDFFSFGNNHKHKNNNQGNVNHSSSTVEPYCKSQYCHRKDTLDHEGYCPTHSIKKLGPATKNDVDLNLRGKSETELGGSSSALTPFRAPLPLAIIEQFHQEKKISKGLLQKLRGIHEQMLSKNPAMAEKARKMLVLAANSPVFANALPQ